MSTSKTDLLLKGLIAALLVALIAVAGGSLEQRVIVSGDKAPDFQIVADNGKTITRSDFGGKLLVLNFWATWCPPCIQELPSLNAFQEQMRSKGVVVLGVSVDKNAATYQNFVKRTGISFVTARDPEANISSDYGTFKYPETYIINSGGKVVAKFIGPENWMDDRVIRQVQSFL